MFKIPTLLESVQRARAAFKSNMKGADAYLWPNNVNPTAKVIGGVQHELFGFADDIQRQKFALTADGENLDLHGAECGIARKPAAPAVGTVTVTATQALTVMVGAVFQRADGVEYLATDGGAITGAGSFDVAVIASTDGSATNGIAGAPLAIVSGVAGDTDAVAVIGSDGIRGGADIERDGEPFTDDLATYRGRILFRKRNPPHGGAPADYVLWATDIAGVTRVFVERRWQGAGTVRVFVLMDDLFDNGIPDSASVARVADYIATKAPAGAIVSVQAPVAVPIDVTIADLTPNTVPVRAAVEAELRNAFFRNSRVAGGDEMFGSMPYLATPTSFSESWIGQAVANAAGERRHRIITPSADQPLVAGQIATLGNITYV